MKALTAAEMRQVDLLTTERYGIPSLQLMENAGTRFFEFLRSSYGDLAASHAAVLCGKGNNGGDGFVAARLLQEKGLKPVVYLFSRQDAVPGDASENLARLKKSGAKIQEITSCENWEQARREIAKSRLIVDALLGTGLKGKVEGLLASVVEDVNKISRDATSLYPEAVVALDTPSGLPSDGESSEGPVVCAHATVTFTAPKVGQLVSARSACCGRLHVREIGSPYELITELGKSKISWIEPREFLDLHMVRHAETQKFITSLVRQTELPVILDADGLNAFAGRGQDLVKRKTKHLALTPHPGEMARLLGLSNATVQADRLAIAWKAAKAWKAHIILKRFHTILATPDARAFVNTTGSPRMAKGGSGDVLTGILAGTVSQLGRENWESALALGVYLHGRAGDEKAPRHEEITLLAGEIADTLPYTYDQLLTELRDLA